MYQWCSKEFGHPHNPDFFINLLIIFPNALMKYLWFYIINIVQSAFFWSLLLLIINSLGMVYFEAFTKAKESITLRICVFCLGSGCKPHIIGVSYSYMGNALL